MSGFPVEAFPIALLFRQPLLAAHSCVLLAISTFPDAEAEDKAPSRRGLCIVQVTSPPHGCRSQVEGYSEQCESHPLLVQPRLNEGVPRSVDRVSERHA